MPPYPKLLLAAGALFALTACSAGSPTPAPEPAPASSAVMTPTPTPTPTAAACPDGRYTVTGLRGQGSASALGTGSGGDVIMTFDGAGWSLSSDGAQPVKLDVGPTTADLTINGSISGSYTSDPLVLQVAAATGTATVKGFGVSREASMQQVADQLVAGQATGTASCDGDRATLTLPNVVLDLTRS